MSTEVINWSGEQVPIFDHFRTRPYDNLVVRARAGTGKTTTICEAVNYAPEDRVLLAAFNTKIKDALTEKGTRADVKTLHGIGLGLVRWKWRTAEVNFGSDRAVDLAQRVCKENTPDDMRYLVQQLHTKAREMAPHAEKPGDLVDIIYRFELEPDPEWVAIGYDRDWVEARALEAMVLAAAEEPLKTGIDGADMIFLPLRNRWLRKKWKRGIVDEAQDMTAAQLELFMGVCHGPIVVVGDDRQAIYGFRGADSGSLDRLKKELRAHELGLTTTYRCGKLIVDEARRFVYDFRAGAENPMGEVLKLHLSQLVKTVQPGDFVLSRANAPLVGIAMELFRAGKRARIAGQDVGSALIRLVRKLSAPTVVGFLENLKRWEAEQIERFTAAGKEGSVQRTKDKAAMLVELAEDVQSVRALTDKIDHLFSDKGLGAADVVTLSSVHKSKGLEAKRVFILQETMRDNELEEQNIQYVAITRAMQQLTYVSGRV